MRVGIRDELTEAPQEGQTILSPGMSPEQAGHLIIEAIFYSPSFALKDAGACGRPGSRGIPTFGALFNNERAAVDK
jgi:hypothetical protein